MQNPLMTLETFTGQPCSWFGTPFLRLPLPKAGDWNLTCTLHVLVPYQAELWSALRVGGLELLLETTLTAFQSPCFAFLHKLIPCDALHMNMISRPCHSPAWIRLCSLPGTWFVALGLWKQSQVHSSMCFCTHIHPILSYIFISVQQRSFGFALFMDKQLTPKFIL